MAGRSRGAQEKGHVIMIKRESLASGGRAEKPAQTRKGHVVEGGQQEDQAPQPQSTHTGVNE